MAKFSVNLPSMSFGIRFNELGTETADKKALQELLSKYWDQNISDQAELIYQLILAVDEHDSIAEACCQITQKERA